MVDVILVQCTGVGTATASAALAAPLFSIKKKKKKKMEKMWKKKINLFYNILP